MTPPAATSLARRASRRLQFAVWPEWRVLGMPVILHPPPPREFACFGDGSWIAPPARVVGASQMAFGAGVTVMEQAELVACAGPGAAGHPVLHVGDGARLGRFITVWATVGIRIGSGVTTGDCVALLDCWGPTGGVCGGVPAPEGSPIVIGDGAFLGGRSIIGPGVTVGEGAYVGEGAVLTESVPPHSFATGNPARVTGSTGG